MSLLSMALWIQSTEFFTALRISTFIYPMILGLHLAGIALFGGLIIVSDLRLLGLIMRDRSVSDVVDQLRVLKRVGFIVVATCGLLMAGSKAEEYYYNAFFRTKLLLFALVAVHALVFRRSVYGNLAALDKAPVIPGRAKLAAVLSLLLWTGVMIAGRGIGYLQAPDNIHASIGLLNGR